jgi:hypothetical protein
MSVAGIILWVCLVWAVVLIAIIVTVMLYGRRQQVRPRVWATCPMCMGVGGFTTFPDRRWCACPACNGTGDRYARR